MGKKEKWTYNRIWSMKTETLIKKLRSKEISLEEALVELSKTGSCPNLLNDDCGHWAVVFEGFQSLPMDGKPDDIETHFWIEKAYWHDDIIDALIYSLEN